MSGAGGGGVGAGGPAGAGVAGDPHAFRCACCGARTLADEPFGSEEVCPACGWTQDDGQEADPLLAEGANGWSLVEARARAATGS